jgi:hypothetical protein
MCGFAGLALPRCIMQAATLLAAAAGSPLQQLQELKPVQLPALPRDVWSTESVNEAFTVPCRE